MLRNSKSEIPYNDIDYEIRDLVKYINNVDGIETYGSCCGHGEGRAWIILLADSIEDINKFMYTYFYCNDGWEISLYMTDVDIDNKDWSKLRFMLHTVIDYKYVDLAISNVTKLFYIKQHTDLINKIVESQEDRINDDMPYDVC